jgi:hypothetical protein
MKFIIAAIAACALLTACNSGQLASVQSGAVQFCETDQPVVGAVATVVTSGVAVAAPAAAAAAPITGLIVQDVNGVCAALTAAPVAPPPAGTQVVVPAS